MLREGVSALMGTKSSKVASAGVTGAKIIVETMEVSLVTGVETWSFPANRKPDWRVKMAAAIIVDVFRLI